MEYFWFLLGASILTLMFVALCILSTVLAVHYLP